MKQFKKLTALFILTLPFAVVNGQTLSWAKVFNAPNGAFYGHRSAMDASGNYYSAGSTFVLKVSPSGTQIWRKDLPSGIIAMSMDESGNLLLAGNFKGTLDFDPGAGTFNLVSAGYDDIYVLALDGNGNFLWARNMGGIGQDFVWDLVSGGSGIYLSGEFGYFGAAPAVTADFDPGPGTYEVQSNGVQDRYLLKLDPNGNFQWVRTSGTLARDGGFLMTVSPQGEIFQLHFENGNAYLDKWDGDGDLLWSKLYKTSTQCCIDITDITTDASGNLIAGGYFSGTVDFDPGPGVFNVVGPDGQDGFVWKLDNNGNLIWAKPILGGWSNPVNGITTDAYGNIYSSGFFSGTGNHDFDPGPGTFAMNCGNTRDMFVLKLNAAGNFKWAIQVGGGNNSGANGYGLEVNSSGQVYSSVGFNGTVDFDPGKAKLNLTGNFAILKLTQPNNGASRFASEEPVTERINFDPFPNPTKGSIYFDIPENLKGETVITVTDMMGRVIMKQTVVVQPGMRVSLDLGRLDAGAYLVQFTSGEATLRSKVIKN